MNETAALAKDARRGDKAAFGKLYEHFLPELYRYALYYLGTREAAQDAVQDTALEAFRGIVNLRDINAVKSWFFTILSNTCKQGLRSKYSAEIVDIEQCFEVSAPERSEDVITAIELAVKLNSLSCDERETVLLSVICGYNSKEIAHMTGSKPGTVRSKLSRSLAKLRQEEEI